LKDKSHLNALNALKNFALEPKGIYTLTMKWMTVKTFYSLWKSDKISTYKNVLDAML
jgi:hypothetical protein